MYLRCGVSAGVSQLCHLQASGTVRGDPAQFRVQATAGVKLSNITTIKCLQANQSTKCSFFLLSHINISSH